MPDPTEPRQDVPDELLDLAEQAWVRLAAPARPGGYDHKNIRRYVLAAVLPVHERMVRNQAAREIHDRAAIYADAPTGPRASFRRGMEAAARHIAPTPTPREIADAIRRGDAVVCNPSEEDE